MLTSNERAQTRLGEYRLTAELASSPSSRVYLAENPGSTGPSRQPVVVKWFYTLRLREQQEKDAFFREVYHLQQVRHPHLLPILSAGFEDDSPYLIVAYAPNRSLHDRLQATPSSPLAQDEALTILAQVGRALQYLHQQQIIHGNLKPQNILFNDRGEALLADCHLDSLLPPPPPPAPPADPFQIPAFEEPDLSGGRFSKESDQYALGEIAYELFTGRKPFTTPSLSNAGMQFRTRTLIPPTKLNPALSPFIEEVILKAMAKEPMERYHNIQTFLTALGITSQTSLLEELAAGSAPVAGRAAQVQAESPGAAENEMTMPVLAEDMPTRNMPSPASEPAAGPQPQLFLPPTSLPTNAQASLPPGEPYPRPPMFVSNNRTGAAPAYGGLARGRQSLKRRDMLLVLITCGLVVAIVVGGLSLLIFSPHSTNQNPTASTQRLPADATTATSASPTVAPTDTPVPTPTLAPTPTPVPIILNPTPTPVPTPTATPTPATTTADGFTTTPTALNANSCKRGRGFGGRYTCTVTLKLGARFPQAESWTASGSGMFAQFTPARGQLNPGQSVQITVSIFAVCPSKGTMTFSGAQTQASVPWSC